LNSTYELHGLIVSQNGQYYSVAIPNGLVIAQIYTGNDGAFLLDAKCLDYITKLLAKRWHLAKRDNLLPHKVCIVLTPNRIFVGVIVENLLHLPQMALGGNDIDKVAAGEKDSGELLHAQGRENVGQQVDTCIRHGQAISGGYGELGFLQSFGGPPDGKFGDVDTGNLRRFACAAQCLKQAGGIVPFAAAAVKQDRGGIFCGQTQGQISQSIPQRGVIALIQKGAPGGHHLLVVAGVFGVLLVGGQQVGITLGGAVVAMALGAGIGALPAIQWRSAQGASEQTFHAFTSQLL